ncbi:MAG: 50S ribosomal protein L29 [bacterium]
MTVKELKEKTDAELQVLLRSERDRVRDLRFKISQDQHKDVRDLREARKLVARILTLQRERSLK